MQASLGSAQASCESYRLRLRFRRLVARPLQERRWYGRGHGGCPTVTKAERIRVQMVGRSCRQPPGDHRSKSQWRKQRHHRLCCGLRWQAFGEAALGVKRPAWRGGWQHGGTSRWPGAFSTETRAEAITQRASPNGDMARSLAGVIAGLRRRNSLSWAVRASSRRFRRAHCANDGGSVGGAMPQCGGGRGAGLPRRTLLPTP